MAIPEEYTYKDLENNVDVYDKNISVVRLNNEKTLDDYNKLKKDKNSNLKDLMDHSKHSYSSPTKYLQKKE